MHMYIILEKNIKLVISREKKVECFFQILISKKRDILMKKK